MLFKFNSLHRERNYANSDIHAAQKDPMCEGFFYAAINVYFVNLRAFVMILYIRACSGILVCTVQATVNF